MHCYHTPPIFGAYCNNFLIFKHKPTKLDIWAYKANPYKSCFIKISIWEGFWNLKRQKLPFLTDRKRNKSGFFYHKLPNHSDKKLLFARNWVTVRFDTPYQGCKTTVSCLLESSYSRSTVPTYSDQGIQISRHSSLQEATCLLYQILALEAVKKITQIQVFEKKITEM